MGLSADLFRLLLAEHELMTGEVNLVEFRRVLQQRFGVPDVEIRFAETLLREQTVVPEPEDGYLRVAQVRCSKDVLGV